MDVRWTRQKPRSQMLVNSFTSSSLEDAIKANDHRAPSAKKIKEKYGLVPKALAPEEEAWYGYCYTKELMGSNPEYLRPFLKKHLEFVGLTDPNWVENVLYVNDLDGRLRAAFGIPGMNFVVDGRDPAAYREYINGLINDPDMPSYPWQ